MRLLFHYSGIQKAQNLRLVDVTDMARMAGIKKRTAMTKAAWDNVIDVSYHNSIHRSIANTLWDVVVLLFLALESQGTEPVMEISYQVAVLKNGASTEVTLKAKFTLEPDGEIRLIIMLPEE